ncbi:MAG: DUF4330 domain-containing protein [Oscillospiraceae bacterium]|nr:DUF4330 domain-containing protein [Oscillospiraceae bacterium]
MATKTKFRFNFIDIILILIILTAAGILAYIFMSGNIENFRPKTVTIEYQVSITQIKEEFRGKVNWDDKVVDSVKQMAIGKVVDVKYEDSIYTTTILNSGEIIYAVYPEHLDMTVTIQAEATLKDGLYNIGGYHISVGTLVSLRVPNFTEQGYCITIKEVKK